MNIYVSPKFKQDVVEHNKQAEQRLLEDFTRYTEIVSQSSTKDLWVNEQKTGSSPLAVFHLDNFELPDNFNEIIQIANAQGKKIICNYFGRYIEQNNLTKITLIIEEAR